MVTEYIPLSNSSESSSIGLNLLSYTSVNIISRRGQAVRNIPLMASFPKIKRGIKLVKD